MDIKRFDRGNSPRTLADVLGLLMILTIAFSSAGGVRAQEPAPPEGWHDGAVGTTNAAGCTAFGWAVDPDDRARDLAVQILVDGAPVASTTANLFRPEVTDCQDGTCGFNVNLWGLMTAGVTHRVTAQAYDVETGTWFDLSGTDKQLTCWGYPEGFHDGERGNVDSNSCTAFGWAVDPDNRDRDVEVRILADGLPVATTTADLLRPDVTECPGGTCGWSVNLWGLISERETHTIRAQAYDVETAKWMDLEATPKSLACFSQDAFPFLIAFTAQDAVEAWSWPDGTSVQLSIDDPSTPVSPDFTAEGTVAPTTWGDPRTYYRFDFAGTFDLKPGHIVSVSDGVATKIHEVRNLGITTVNAALDTVSGKADPGAQVQVWPHGFDQTATVEATADASGDWVAAFGNAFDVVAGSSGRSQIVDRDWDATAVDWSAPSPWFTAFPDQDVVEGWDWPLGATIHMQIDDPSTELSPDFAIDAQSTTPPWGSDGRWVWFEFPGEYDLKVGDTVTLTDGVTPQTHTVQPLAIRGTDADQNTVVGTADPGRTVDLWSWEDPEGRRVSVTADSAGAWRADFDEIGFDLVPGDHVRAEVWDEYGNDTAVDWSVEAPPPPPTPITHGTHVRLPADAGWLDSGVAVAADVPISIAAHGEAQLLLPRNDRLLRSGPAGTSPDCWGACALDGAPYGALIGRIGLYGQPFVIGSSFELISNIGGELYLAVNDNDIYYSDNSGNYIVLLSQ